MWTELTAMGAAPLLLTGFAVGLALAVGAAWWLWGRRAPIVLSPVALPPPLDWPAALPPPVGRQLWLVPDEPARRRVLRALSDRLARRGPVLLLARAPEDCGPLPGVARLAGDPADTGRLEAAVAAMVGAPLILVAGEIPALGALLRASPAPVLAVLTPAEPSPQGAAPAVVLSERDGALYTGDSLVFAG